MTKHQKVSKYDENGCGDDLLLLGITIGKKLTFKQHIENLCQKEQHKLHALRCCENVSTIEKAKIFSNAFLDSQFNYVLFL